eukprot:scaffold221_cov189-Alexandrium_tamarense.AAC.2
MRKNKVHKHTKYPTVDAHSEEYQCYEVPGNSELSSLLQCSILHFVQLTIITSYSTPIYSYLQPIAMLAGKFIKLLVVATALSNADAGNGRKRNRRNRNANYAPVGTGGYGSISKNPTSAPIVAIVTPEPTLSPSLSPSMAKWNGEAKGIVSVHSRTY